MLFIVTILLSFVLNFIWENAHAHLYVHHLGGTITQKVLFIATLGDVVILSSFVLLFKTVPFLREHIFLFVPIALFVAYIIEKYALSSHRWAYNESMPIVPMLGVGLSPFVQLAATGLILFFVLVKYKLI